MKVKMMVSVLQFVCFIAFSIDSFYIFGFQYVHLNLHKCKKVCNRMKQCVDFDEKNEYVLASATITTTTTITLTTLDPENNNDSVSIPIKTTTTSTKSSVTDRDNNNKIQCDNKNKGESDTHPQNSQNVSKLTNKASRSTSASTEERNQVRF